LNEALALVRFPLGMVGRFPETANFVINTKGRAFRPQTAMSNDLSAALVEEPMAQLHWCATRFSTLRGSA
jgi:hypothetical protein